MVDESSWGVSLICLGVVVEGHSEAEFVRCIVTDHLRCFGLAPTPINMKGDVHVDRLARMIAGAYLNFDAVTSLVDFYGFRDKGGAAVDCLERKIEKAAWSLIQEEDERKVVIPYVQKYEFEALLFANVEAFATIGVSPDVIGQLKLVRSDTMPEEINDSRDTAPSKRIARLMEDYDMRYYNKVAESNLIASEIGLPAMRAACPRFDAWITRLEALAET